MSVETFRHWQSKQIEQFSNLVNIILLIVSAFLGFLITLKTNGQKYIFTNLLIIMIVITSIIIFLIIVISFNRLRDFRLTTQKQFNRNLISQEDLKKIGNLSWNLLYLSLVLIGIDLVIFLIFIFSNY